MGAVAAFTGKRSPMAVYAPVKIEPRWDPLRPNPRFRALLTKSKDKLSGRCRNAAADSET